MILIEKRTIKRTSIYVVLLLLFIIVKNFHDYINQMTGLSNEKLRIFTQVNVNIVFKIKCCPVTTTLMTLNDLFAQWNN